VNVTDSSQGMAVDPDTYLFWDSLHPTTRGHDILATTAAEIIAQRECREHSDAAGLTDPHADCAGEVAVETSGAKH
jgi:hypothetical protein